MKFKAHIKLTEEQNILNRIQGIPERESVDFEFTFCSLIKQIELYYKQQVNIYDDDVINILIPWLGEGGEPAIIDCEPVNLQISWLD